jgi:hypothetical protein
MTCAPSAPVFWQRQPRLPMPVMRFLNARIEAALADPAARALLVWPLVLGAPGLLESHPDGVPELELLARAEPMLRPLGVTDPDAAWAEAVGRLPDTADLGRNGWTPHRIWAPLGALVSLRLGVALLALMGQPEDDRYPLAAGAALFNSALFHESHSAFEQLWRPAGGDLRAGLQGLILLAGGFHHLQLENAGGMISLWRDALAILELLGGALRTPWGLVECQDALESAAQRLAWLNATYDGDMPLSPLWAMSRPVMELT